MIYENYEVLKTINQIINHKNFLISFLYLASDALASDALCNSEENNKDFHMYKYRNLTRSQVSKIVIICSNFQLELQVAKVCCL